MTRSMPQLPLVLPREENMEEYEVSSVVRGFHVYQRSWSPSLEEQLECLREAGNDKDRYAVAVRAEARKRCWPHSKKNFGCLFVVHRKEWKNPLPKVITAILFCKILEYRHL